MKLLDKRCLVLSATVVLAACSSADTAVGSAPVNPYGPAADYPMVLGAPFAIDGELYTPVDTLNYDSVGQVVTDQAGGAAISAEHRTLPLPSYIEVTSLETGKTILVRVERRGPMTGRALIGLSPGAMEQLGVQPGTAVRVRRVNPVEQERAMLRRGERAPECMDTPKSLVEVLRRKLPAATVIPESHRDRADTMQAPASAQRVTPANVVPERKADFASTKPPVSAPSDAMVAPKGKGRYFVQAGAFSVQANAQNVANKINGTIVSSGKLHLVRVGPFPGRKEAEASLAKVKGAGYTGARIYDTDR